MGSVSEGVSSRPAPHVLEAVLERALLGGLGGPATQPSPRGRSVPGRDVPMSDGRR
jgi:hypothetical protein